MIENIYVIHYTKLIERKQSIFSYIENFKLPYKFIENYDKEQLPEKSLQRFYLPDESLFESKIKNLWDINQHKFRYLTPGEISVAIKHFLAIQTIGENNKIGLILEDDALPLKSTFLEQIHTTLNQLPEDWDAVFIGEGCGVNYIKNRIAKDNLQISNNMCKAKHPVTNCAESYIIKPQLAKKISEISFPFQLAFDWELAYILYKLNANVYWSVPPIFTQGSKNGIFNSVLR